jgi:prevent-host-death family protein
MRYLQVVFGTQKAGVDQLDQNLKAIYSSTHMADTINIYEAKTHLSALVEKAAQGKEFVIAKAGKPMAKLVPLEPKLLAPREFGQKLLGITYISPDFDAPLPEDLVEDFYGPIEPER